jgi:hypothetical protein
MLFGQRLTKALIVRENSLIRASEFCKVRRSVECSGYMGYRALVICGLGKCVVAGFTIEEEG